MCTWPLEYNLDYYFDCIVYIKHSKTLVMELFHTNSLIFEYQKWRNRKLFSKQNFYL
jgi:hypothetical protein